MSLGARFRARTFIYISIFLPELSIHASIQSGRTLEGKGVANCTFPRIYATLEFRVLAADVYRPQIKWIGESELYVTEYYGSGRYVVIQFQILWALDYAKLPTTGESVSIFITYKVSASKAPCTRGIFVY